MKRVVVATIIVLAGCGATGTSAEPAGQVDSPFALRATWQQDRPPDLQFRWIPMRFVTSDGIVIGVDQVEAPAPLILPLTQAPLSAAGFDRIVQQARTRGLVGGSGDFVPPEADDQAMTVLIELRVDGSMQEFRGDANAVLRCVTDPCEPVPGSPEAFAAFLREDLTTILDEELDEANPYEPEGYAVLIGADPIGDPTVDRDVRLWPLETPMAEIGAPTARDPALRCLTVRGEEAGEIPAAFAGADELTYWLDAGRERSEAVGVLVRALLPGDDLCLEYFGVEG